MNAGPLQPETSNKPAAARAEDVEALLRVQAFRRLLGKAGDDEERFSEVSALVYLPYEVTNESTFENLCTLSGKRPMMT